ncbi:hypothetical protein IE978_12600 [Klebsiella pneumoniae]|uniref:Uncharacterized protein n=1 Tax=Klebsiella pneumoniae TaxID=573 RepID=A0A927DZM0_KLEPN|nr:hypothetical protein [Klebsiella pneumoniae]
MPLSLMYLFNRVDESGSIDSPVKAKYTLPCGREKDVPLRPPAQGVIDYAFFSQKCPAQRPATLHDEISQNQRFSVQCTKVPITRY